jgi:hypothetical protein
MEALMKQVKDDRKVRDSTIKIYQRHLNKLSDAVNGEKFKNIKFLKSKVKEVKKFVNKQTPSTKKNYIASILVALSPHEKKKPLKGYDAVYDDYLDSLLTEHNKYNEFIKSREKSVKTSENWVDWNDILKLQRKYGRDIKKKGYKQSTKELFNKKDLDLIQKYLVISLYTLHAPRRLEYADTKILSKTEFDKLSEKEKDNGIYLVVVSRNKKFFSFGKEKVKSETPDNFRINVDRSLNSVLNLWLNFNKNDYLLQDSRGEKMSKNQLSKYLNKVFSPTGKKISSSMLRKIKITNEFDAEEVEKKQKLAKEMNHSVGVQQSVYLKKD